MNLRGQDSNGYAMAALLVALAVMSIMMTVALPVWRHEAQRRKEDELIWRGNQYVRAIRLYSMKMGGALPTSVDALVDGHFLRKKYKDPITNDDFELLGGGSMPGMPPGQGQSQPGAIGRAGQPTPGTMSTSGMTTGGMVTGGGTVTAGMAPGGMATNGMTTGVMPMSTMPTSTMAATGGTVAGGLTGVRSKSKDESIKVYLGRTHYNEWTFMYVSQQPGIGTGRGGRGVPQRGRPGENQPNPFGIPGRGGVPPGRGRPIGPGRGFGPGASQVPPGFPPTPGRRGGGR